jgi:hypothetical protein
MFFQLLRERHEEVMCSNLPNPSERLIELLNAYLLTESRDKYREYG